jgi:hypothetical protein
MTTHPLPEDPAPETPVDPDDVPEMPQPDEPVGPQTTSPDEAR